MIRLIWLALYGILHLAELATRHKALVITLTALAIAAAALTWGLA